MDDAGTHKQPPAVAIQSANEPAATAPKQPPRPAAAKPSSSQGWCTTLQQPATIGVFGFIVSHFLRRQRK